MRVSLGKFGFLGEELQIKKASPPRPQKWGCVTHKAAAVAIAASIAFPPPSSTLTPHCVATRCGLVTMPNLDTAFCAGDG